MDYNNQNNQNNQDYNQNYNQNYNQPYQQAAQPYNSQMYNQQQSYKPVSLGEWLILMLVTCIPCVGTIMLLVWAFGTNTHPSKKSYCQAVLIFSIICAVLSVVLYVVFAAALFAELSTNSYYYY